MKMTQKGTGLDAACLILGGLAEGLWSLGEEFISASDPPPPSPPPPSCAFIILLLLLLPHTYGTVR